MTSHALTIDVEDWHQMFRRRLGRPMGAPSAEVQVAVHRLLDLLDAAGVKATFFVVGLLAEARPELVREIAGRGHEVGSHSHAHRLVYTMNRHAFVAEMRDARRFLQDLSGQPVLGFRAPEFSVRSLDHWCFEALAEVGFSYDSSVFPIRARYGIVDAPRRPFVQVTKSGSLAEFPLATWNLAGSRGRVPIAGGSYYRLLPGALLSRALAKLEEDDIPATLYFHPYEFQSGRLHLSELGLRDRIRPGYLKYLALHNLFTNRIGARLAPLLGRFRFIRLDQLQDELFGTTMEAH
jgi:polysaccharide deacetylase family protein (PEP-CTERM system associated)